MDWRESKKEKHTGQLFLKISSGCMKGFFFELIQRTIKLIIVSLSDASCENNSQRTQKCGRNKSFEKMCKNIDIPGSVCYRENKIDRNIIHKQMFFFSYFLFLEQRELEKSFCQSYYAFLWITVFEGKLPDEFKHSYSHWDLCCFFVKTYILLASSNISNNEDISSKCLVSY